MQKTNFIYTAISIGSRLVAGLLLFIVLARVWGPADFGAYSFAFGVSMTLGLIVDFGFASYLLREIGAEPGRLGNVFREGLRLKALLILPFVVMSSASLWYFQASLSANLFLPMLLAALALSFSEYCIAPMRALGRYDLESGIISISNLINFGVAAGVAWFGGTPVEVAWASLACRIQYLSSAAIALRKIAPVIKQAGNRLPITTVFRRLLPYGTDGVLSTGWNQLDVVIVGALFGTTTVGIYSAGQKIVQGLYTLAQIAGNVLIPHLARLFHNKDPRFQRSAKLTIFGLGAIGVVLALPLITAAEFFVLKVFGQKYFDLISLFPYFGFILISRFISGASGIVLTAAGFQGTRAWGNFFGLFAFLLTIPIFRFLYSGIELVLIAYFFGAMVMVICFNLNFPKFLNKKDISGV